MMAEWIRSGLDVLLILLVVIGLVQATRLIWHLAGLRASRLEMEQFVREFNATVLRAEAGIRGLKLAARESGDDLEKLVDKSQMVRDELQYIVESADQLADRLAKVASAAARPEAKPPEVKAEPPKPREIKAATVAEAKPQASAAPAPPKDPAPSEAVTGQLRSNVRPVADASQATAPAAVAPGGATVSAPRPLPESKPASRAEKELMQALQKLN